MAIKCSTVRLLFSIIMYNSMSFHVTLWHGMAFPISIHLNLIDSQTQPRQSWRCESQIVQICNFNRPNMLHESSRYVTYSSLRNNIKDINMLHSIMLCAWYCIYNMSLHGMKCHFDPSNRLRILNPTMTIVLRRNTTRPDMWPQSSRCVIWIVQICNLLMIQK